MISYALYNKKTFECLSSLLDTKKAALFLKDCCGFGKNVVVVAICKNQNDYRTSYGRTKEMAMQRNGSYVYDNVEACLETDF